MTRDDTHIVERLRVVLEAEEYAGPVKEAAIVEAERTLNVKFPRSYKAFLLQFGATHLFAGLGPGRHNDPEPPMFNHVVDMTTMSYRATRGNLPSGLVYVSSDGGDYHYYLDTSRPSLDSECPVIVLCPGRDGIDVADSFVEFVEEVMSKDFPY